ncbi:flagellar hook protein FlgE [Alteromonas sp. IB21]|uniref:flagellar hook protein FlgE n=1 Tax=Alteromonas sp. IB21 TaxID=2779369 RepID=UPI0018E8008D|nr:flagellar hook protein FlgE [Alteromonas sp. IB21]MBJ2127619.1 flagellar hook protein FlgE [Alteromonas sp. IB21]
MSFNIALSGVAAAQKDLDVTANNIANVNTVGFKESRAEFGDVYAASLLSGSRTKVGDGVLTQEVAQQFHQGSLQFTNSALDLAITGTGYFAMSSDLSSNDFTYTRAGQFKLNDDNFIVNSSGDNLMGFPVNPDGTSSSTALSTTIPTRVPDSSGSPRQTSEVDIKMNLPANGEYKTVANFDPENQETYNAATSVTIYDSLGESHVMTYYFVRDDTDTTANPNDWRVFASVDGTQVQFESGLDSATLTFDSSGDFVNQVPTVIRTEPLGSTTTGSGTPQNAITNGSDPDQQIIIDFNLDTAQQTINEPTQFASGFEVTSLEQDGLAVGRLTGIDIDSDGLIRASFSNGTSEPISRVALVRFANDQGLTQVSNTKWKESIASGEALAGEATTGTFGEINSSALEQANVNLTTELIDMIIAQRNFQANSRALEVNNSLNQTILNIR